MSVFVPLGRPDDHGDPGMPPRRDPEAASVPYLLVNPPLTDPTAPYHSIPYLVGAAREAGHREYGCVDANLDAFEYLADPARFGATLERARLIRERIGRADATTRLDEIHYRLALAAEGLSPTAAHEAIATFRDPERFYHPPTYRQAMAVMRRWRDLLALDMPVGLLEAFSLRAKGGANLCSTVDLSDAAVIDAISRPFEAYVEDEFAGRLAERPWGLVGFSVNYTGQLPVALRMARAVRRRLPGAVVVFGGTEVGDVVKYTEDRDAVWRVFRDVDLIVPGEGESALIGILDAIGAGRGFEGIGGVMTRSAPACRINYENVAALPSPAFDVWDWDRYWSPEPVILYSPTRGCYWNKCTFCDYGLNTDKPTSPSRERPIAAVLDDLEQASKHGRVLYFAVDAMSPRYLRTLADSLVQFRQRFSRQFKWGAELRLERTFPERAVGSLLAESGCVAISFGYESGSQRVLDRIDKGVRIENVPGVLAELARNGIAAQMMGFTGFPGETDEEAGATYAFLHEHRDLWTTAGIGVFNLTPGSIVARQPGRFGVELLPLPASEDIRRYLPWRDVDTGEVNWPETTDPRISDEQRGWTARVLFERPFVGGIDSAHSLLYYARNGRGLLPDEQGDGDEGEWEREQPHVRLVQQATVSVPFASIDALVGEGEFDGEVKARMRNGLDTTAASYAEWLAQPGSATPGASNVLLLAHGGKIELPAGVDLSADTALSRALRTLIAAQHRA